MTQKIVGMMLTLSLAATAQVTYAFPKDASSRDSFKELTKETFANRSAAKVAPLTPLSLSGKVVETMEAGGYSYICLENSGVRSWVAVPRMYVTVGKEMAFQPGAEMNSFTSKTLNRTFERIVFSSGPIEPKKSNGGKSAPTKAVDLKAIAVEKATGANGYTVAELYKKKNSLDKQTVLVRGKVVKVNSGIMGKSWIHLQDGSGSAATKTNNLVVTSKDIPEEGDVVTAKGVLHKNKDFGSGYKYDLIIEDATLQP